MGPRTDKGRGRPLSAQTVAIRDAVAELETEQTRMTVRGIFYACVSRGVVEKTEGGYRQVQRQVLAMRNTGLLGWAFVADSTRWQRKPTSYGSVEDALADAARTYRRDLWRAQDCRVEVWLEKDALAAIVQQATVPWDVSLMVSRGTSSATFLHAAAEAAVEAYAGSDPYNGPDWPGTKTEILALYDFDAGGERSARAVEQDLPEHARKILGLPHAIDFIEFTRLAILPWQIAAWNLPTRPAKKSDPEAHKFGAEAVELDAIPPDILVQWVSDAIEDNVSGDEWELEKTIEAEERKALKMLPERWKGV
jgi:hypothetical protein